MVRISRIKKWLCAVLPALLLTACGSSDEHSNINSDVSSSYEPVRSEYVDEDSSSDVDDATFADVGDTSDCTEDCSGHDAGFEWARDNGITDASDCGGNSNSFIEGCETYAEEQGDESEW